MTNESKLATVRALLAKAEATQFPAEAEAFTAKAMELMARHGIDEALLAAAGKTEDELTHLVVDLLAPYAADKGSLLSTIGRHNTCRTIRTKYGKVRRMYVHGWKSDLERVEMLYTSLLLQMTAGVLRPYHHGGAMPANTPGESKSNRIAWMAGFIHAVDGRLKAAHAAAVAESVASTPGSTEPGVALVLRDRSLAVDDAVGEMFPKLRKGQPRYIRGSGYSNGHAAGMRADLGAKRVGNSRRELA